jgi:hypothetical protein
MRKFSIGADPEVFVATEDGTIISAEGLVGGGKFNPTEFDERGFFVLEDNVMLEFNVPPAESEEEFVDNILYAKDWIDMFLQVNGNQAAYHKVTNVFDPKYLKSEQASEFGCLPDFNVYTREKNPQMCVHTNIRSCGGHIHIGFDYSDQKEQEDLAKALDITLSLDAVLLDSDTKRRESYGRAGNIRFKHYGIEYRTPSNFWIANEQLIRWVYNRVKKAFEILPIIDEFEEFTADIRKSIDNGDVKLSLKTVEKINSKIKIKIS